MNRKKICKNSASAKSAALSLLRRIPIFPRLFCIMIILAVIPATAITIISFRSYVAEIGENTENFISLLVGNIAIQMNDRMETYENAAVSFYSDSSVLSLLEENASIAQINDDYLHDERFKMNRTFIEQRLYKLMQNNRYVTNLQFITPYTQYFMLDEKGNRRGCMLHDLDAFLSSRYYSDALEAEGYPCWFDTTEVKNLIYRYPESHIGTGGTLTMTIAVYTLKTRNFLGVLMYNIDTDFLSQALTNYAFYGTGNTFLVSGSSVIAALNPNIKAPSINDNSAILSMINRDESGSFYFDDDGRLLFVSYQKSDKLDLYAVHVVDMDSMIAPAVSIRNRCLILILVILTLCLIVARVTAQSIRVPLTQLVRSMVRFGHNDKSVRCDEDGNDELTLVSEGFNHMAQDSQRMSDEIIASKIREKTLQLNKAMAELNALQMQIRPHFLYNTLDMIRWEMIRLTGGESSATGMLDSFCRLMRMSVKKDEDFVSISSELEHVSVYIEVVNFRTIDKISLDFSFDFDTASYAIPMLTLQPLVENAVVHGFRKHSSHPCIYIRGSIEDENICISVIDNGNGMDQKKLDQLRKTLADVSQMEQSSIGLKNVCQRFKLLYGNACRVEVFSVEKEETEVRLSFPAVRYPVRDSLNGDDDVRTSYC